MITMQLRALRGGGGRAWVAGGALLHVHVRARACSCSPQEREKELSCEQANAPLRINNIISRHSHINITNFLCLIKCLYIVSLRSQARFTHISISRVIQFYNHGLALFFTCTMAICLSIIILRISLRLLLLATCNF